MKSVKLTKESIRYILEAIEDVKLRINQAVSDGDVYVEEILVADLLALENCLVTEVTLLMKQDAA